jgi:hypothetical protein
VAAKAAARLAERGAQQAAVDRPASRSGRKENSMYSIDQNVDALESILRQLEAGYPENAKAITQAALYNAVQQQRKHWQYWEDRQREELAAAALCSAAHLYEEASAEEVPW